MLCRNVINPNVSTLTFGINSPKPIRLSLRKWASLFYAMSQEVSLIPKQKENLFLRHKQCNILFVTSSQMWFMGNMSLILLHTRTIMPRLHSLFNDCISSKWMSVFIQDFLVIHVVMIKAFVTVDWVCSLLTIVRLWFLRLCVHIEVAKCVIC